MAEKARETDRILFAVLMGTAGILLLCAVIAQPDQTLIEGFLRIQHVSLERIAHLTAQIVQSHALGIVEVHHRNRRVTDRGNVIFIIAHAVITVDTRNNKGRNDENHGDKHHPSFMSTKSLKHFPIPCG